LKNQYGPQDQGMAADDIKEELLSFFFFKEISE
jgi:hypothetical protein